MSRVITFAVRKFYFTVAALSVVLLLSTDAFCATEPLRILDFRGNVRAMGEVAPRSFATVEIQLNSEGIDSSVILADAQVELYSLNEGRVAHVASSDSTGRVVFRMVAAGRYRVQVKELQSEVRWARVVSDQMPASSGGASSPSVHAPVAQSSFPTKAVAAGSIAGLATFALILSNDSGGSDFEGSSAAFLDLDFDTGGGGPGPGPGPTPPPRPPLTDFTDTNNPPPPGGGGPAPSPS